MKNQNNKIYTAIASKKTRWLNWKAKQYFEKRQDWIMALECRDNLGTGMIEFKNKKVP